MHKHLPTTTDELAQLLDRMPTDGYLFRGQVHHHVDAHGSLSILPSFHRKGCVPGLTRKWIHYANTLIEYFSGGKIVSDVNLSGALLQHYGWRSFFVDASTDPSVGTWFAAHSYSERLVETSMVDRWLAQFVSIQRSVSYSCDPATTGSLYALSRAALTQHNIGVVDLSQQFQSLDGPTRMLSQRAALVGPLDTALPDDVVAFHIEAPASVFRGFAEQQGYASHSHLFPSRTDDPILAALLKLPWENQTDSSYQRSLSLPEYEQPLPKPSAEEAYVNGVFWISKHRQPPLSRATFLCVPELLLYASGPAEDPDWTRLFEFVFDANLVVVETSALWMDPRVGDASSYGKGLILTARGFNLVEVAELVLEHPGTDVSVLAANRGYSYRLGRANPERVRSPDDCPCANESRHAHHLTILTHVAEMLTNRKLHRTGTLELTHLDCLTRQRSSGL